MLNSMIGFGQATATFTLNQMQNAVFMLTDPGRALRRLQHSIDNLSSAMNERVEDALSPNGSPKA
jgi:hypothetical protein